MCGSHDIYGEGRLASEQPEKRHTLYSSWAGRCPSCALTQPKWWCVLCALRTLGSTAVVSRSCPSCSERDLYKRLMQESIGHPLFPPPAKSSLCASSTPCVHGGICIHQEAAIYVFQHCARCFPFLPGVGTVDPFYRRGKVRFQEGEILW